MSGFEGIIFAFLEFRKTTETFILAQSMEISLSAGYQLMGIGLVADIPDYFIFWGVKNMMKSQGKANPGVVSKILGEKLG